MKVSINFDPRDLWIGMYWTIDTCHWNPVQLKLFLCLIPCFPIALTINLPIDDPWCVNLTEDQSSLKFRWACWAIRLFGGYGGSPSYVSYSYPPWHQRTYTFTLRNQPAADHLEWVLSAFGIKATSDEELPF